MLKHIPDLCSHRREQNDATAQSFVVLIAGETGPPLESFLKGNFTQLEYEAYTVMGGSYGLKAFIAQVITFLSDRNVATRSSNILRL